MEKIVVFSLQSASRQHVSDCVVQRKIHDTLRSYFFQELCLITPWHGLCDWKARRPCCHSLDSAQHGVSSVPLYAQIIACSLHSGREGGSQKQICEPACQSHRIYSVCVYTRKLTRGVIADALHMFFTSKTALFAHDHTLAQFS